MTLRVERKLTQLQIEMIQSFTDQVELLRKGIEPKDVLDDDDIRILQRLDGDVQKYIAHKENRIESIKTKSSPSEE